MSQRVSLDTASVPSGERLKILAGRVWPLTVMLSSSMFSSSFTVAKAVVKGR